MSTRHTTVGQLNADDLGKRVEGDDWVIEQVNYIRHFESGPGSSRGVRGSHDGFGPGTDLLSGGPAAVRRLSHDTPCTVTNEPAEPLDPAYRHVGKSGRVWARVENLWVSLSEHPLSWEDLLERHGWGDS